VEVPEGVHDFQASHPAFYDVWSILKSAGMGRFEKLNQTSYRSDDNSTMIDSDGALHVYKIRRSDITSETKPYNGEPYDMDDVAQILDSSPPNGLDRFVLSPGQEIVVYENLEASNTSPSEAFRQDVKDVYLSQENISLHGAYEGYFGDRATVTWQQGGPEPERPYLQVIWDTSDAGGHAENTEGNEIWRGTAFINPDTSEPLVSLNTARAEVLQSACMRDDIVNRIQPDIFDGNELTSFGEYLGKMCYIFNPGTYFTQDHQ
jgi:hypothetical protein